MATCIPTTNNCFPEPAVAFTPTAASKAFSRLLGALAAHIEAERDIEDVASFDPAFIDWQRDAERARADVLSIIAELRHAPIHRQEDIPLKRMNYVMYAMIQSDCSEEFLRLRTFMSSNVSLFSCPGQGPVTRRIQQMLSSACNRVDELAALGTYVDPLDVDFSGMLEMDYVETEPAEPDDMMVSAA